MTTAVSPTTQGEPERLQRYLAHAGIASRRAAEELIVAGRVSVNGSVTTGLGTKVRPGVDRVEVDGRPVAGPRTDHAYYVLNKPAGYVTTLSDPHGRPTIRDLLPNDGRRLFPVGRLDLDTTGLLLLTDDGELAHRLMHPRFHVPKTYRAVVSGTPDETVLGRLRSGLELDDGPTAPAQADLVRVGDGRSVVRITLREGRKRQVRRMLSAVRHPVVSLQRERFGPVELGSLPSGSSRPLTEEELSALRNAAGLGGGA